MIHKTTRSILSVLLAALLLVTSTPLTPAFAGGGGVSLQSESAEGRVLAGTGTEGDPYQIATANDLREFADKVNNQNKASAWAILTADIDLSGICSEESGTSWIPIGSDSSRYSGTFNGDGHTISGLYIKNTSSDTDYQGLFGYVDTGGTVQNLTVSGTVSGINFVGGIAGQNGGRITDCAFSGSVSGVGPVGGVVGQNSGNVENCYNTGTVTGSAGLVGGVVGFNGSGIVTNSYNTGAVSGGEEVGGVVGYNYSGGSVTNSYNTGDVSGKMSVGGVVGCKEAGASVANCYFLKGTAKKGIGTGSGNVTSVTTLNELCDKFKDDPWTISENLDRPVLKDNHEDDGTQAHPYRISTATQLKNFATAVNSGEKSAHAKLMNNIDLNGNELDQWNPIGTSIGNSYEGTFNGDGHTISGLYINRSADYQGLFGYVSTDDDNTGTVKDLTVSGDINGNRYVGGIVGYNDGGTVTGCIFSGSGSVSGSNSVGGVVGENSGSVTGVTGSSNYVGGVVGYNDRGTVTNCYNTDSVSGNSVGGVVGYNSSGIVENCYNTGTVTGSGIYVGGVVGNNGGSVTNCYNTDSVSDGTTRGGVVGQNSGSVTNCYFLQTTEVNDKLQGIGSGSGSATGKNDTAFHSGEVAWLLQAGQTDGSSQVWGQNIKDGENDNYPQLRAFDADTPQVYKVAFMNDNEEHDAKYANIGMTVDLPATEPTKEGYTFSYWQDKAGTQVTEPITVTADTTYTAQWTPHTYSITASPSALNFGSITEGEERPAAQTVTVKNTGNQTVTLNPPTAENFEIAKIDELTLNAGESVEFTIQPKDKLPRGSYSEQIAISNTNGEKAAITATFTVKEPPYTGRYSYEITTDTSDNGSLTVDRYATEGDTVTIQVAPDQAYKLDDLSVTANGKDVELTANSDGTYTFTMPSADVKITASFAEDPDWTPDEPEEPTTDVSDLFIDIAPDAWYKDAVQYAYDNGLMTGVSDTEFAPEATTTRAMIVSILARREGVESAEAAGFTDVTDDWYATAVNWAANVGVVNGYEDNTFKPNTAITREQLAAILMNYAAYKGEDVSNRANLATYTDQPSTWAEEAMSWAVAEKLITGVTADTLQPQGAATRAQVAAILQRFLSE